MYSHVFWMVLLFYTPLYSSCACLLVDISLQLNIDFLSRLCLLTDWLPISLLLSLALSSPLSSLVLLLSAVFSTRYPLIILASMMDRPVHGCGRQRSCGGRGWHVLATHAFG